jgi:lipid A ethanolaminephosphotransferase
MRLRLFHITEYAQSQFLSPETQRQSSHPWVILLVSSLWLAIPGNWVLWHTLLNLPGHSIGDKPWFLIVSLALMLTFAISLLLCVVNWHLTLKPVITLMLLLAAINTEGMLTQDKLLDANLLSQVLQAPSAQVRAIFNWRFFTILMLLCVAPAIWLWRTAVRRFTLVPNLIQNIFFALIVSGLLIGLWLANQHDLTALMQNQPKLGALINPFNTLQSLTQTLMGQPQGS